MTGGKHGRAELARGAQKIAKLDCLVAVDARHRGLAADIALGKPVDHLLLEAAFIIEDVMRNADLCRHPPRVMDILPGAAGARPVRRGAMVIELQGDADYVKTFGLEQGSRGRRIDPARHGHDHAGVLGQTLDIETVAHHRRGAPHSLICLAGACPAPMAPLRP
jgi:hypothetical protein